MNIVVVEDAGVSQLSPITIGRPAYSITCATYRLLDWLPHLGSEVKAIVRPHLRAIQRLDLPHLSRGLNAEASWTLVVNARLVPSVSNLQTLKQFASQPSAGMVQLNEWSIAAAMVPTSELNLNSDDELMVSIERYYSSQPTVHDLPLTMFEYPHDVVRENLNSFDENIEHRIQHGEYREIADGVFVNGDVTVSDFVVTNTENGPIVIDDGSVIGPFCFLRGPIHIGRNCRVNEHSAIKDKVSISHTIKMGGEIEGSVIEPFSNKQHHGFLGHSYLGSWINLGAGTCNSDLKNTYGEVKIEYDGEKVATGMQFVGCIMGDYAKTAINTSIFTGKLIGAGSMLYGFVTTNVPSFVNYARSFGQVTESPPGILELTQKRMFARRKVEQRPCDIQLIYDMYELTQAGRQISEEPLML
jgi:glucose-1-phosphate thymidylyltransferase